MKYCLKCGSSVKVNENFCGKCGTALYNNQTIQNNNINDDELIDAYIGPNATKLKNGTFSANTFFFGIFYILYRKMWIMGILLFVVNQIVEFCLPSFSFVISLTLNIIISIEFKKIYLKHVIDEVNKIKQENPNISQEQLLQICKKKGGISILSILILGLLYVILVIFSLMIYDPVNEIEDGTKTYYIKNIDSSYYEVN